MPARIRGAVSFLVFMLALKHNFLDLWVGRSYQAPTEDDPLLLHEAPLGYACRAAGVFPAVLEVSIQIRNRFPPDPGRNRPKTPDFFNK